MRHTHTGTSPLFPLLRSRAERHMIRVVALQPGMNACLPGAVMEDSQQATRPSIGHSCERHIIPHKRHPHRQYGWQNGGINRFLNSKHHPLVASLFRRYTQLRIHPTPLRAASRCDSPSDLCPFGGLPTRVPAARPQARPFWIFASFATAALGCMINVEQLLAFWETPAPSAPMPLRQLVVSMLSSRG